MSDQLTLDDLAVTPADLRSPYTAEEWQAIVTALRTERERRARKNLPFARADQMAAVDAVLLPLRVTA